MLIPDARLKAVAAWRNDGRGTGIGEGGDQVIGIVALVRDDGARHVHRIRQGLSL